MAVIRVDSSAALLPICEALLDGGVTALEITMTSPDAIATIAEASKEFAGRALMGVGTVLDTETCRAAILAGAEFVVTPVCRPEIVQMAVRYGKPVACGAYTPTEALTAHEAGADFIKLFPADQLGPKYIQNILGPLPMLRIIPTGGVTGGNRGRFPAGGMRGARRGVEPDRQGVPQEQRLAGLTARAKAFVDAASKARG